MSFATACFTVHSLINRETRQMRQLARKTRTAPGMSFYICAEVHVGNWEKPSVEDEGECLYKNVTVFQ